MRRGGLRRVVACLLGLLALFTVGVGCAKKPLPPAPAPPPPSALDVLPQRGELRVCSTGDYRPFSYRDPATDRWVGIDVDMAGDLARKLGVRMTIVPTTWTTVADDVATDHCDVAMGGVSVTLDRARKATYSDPYLVDGKAPITRCTNVARFQNLDQIDKPGVRVVVNTGGTNEEFAVERIKRATVIKRKDNNTIFQELLANRADVLITDASETRYQAKQHPELCPVNPDRPLNFAQKAYLLPRGDVVFQQWVNQWLRQAIGDGTYLRFTRPWTG